MRVDVRQSARLPTMMTAFLAAAAVDSAACNWLAGAEPQNAWQAHAGKAGKSMFRGKTARVGTGR